MESPNFTRKIIKVLAPEIVDLIDFNVLSYNYDLFDEELTNHEKHERIEVYKQTLWALSNLAASGQVTDSERLISKDCYSRIVQIAMTCKDKVEETKLENGHIQY